MTWSVGPLWNTSSLVAGNAGTMGVLLRPVIPKSTTVAGSVAATSTGNITLISSAAGTGIYVYGYSLAAESTANVTVRLVNGSTTSECWRTTLESGASTSALAAGNIDRAELAVSPPAYLFRTSVANPLTYEKGASSVANALVHYSFAFWRE